MHGLVFKTSISLLAGSTRYLKTTIYLKIGLRYDSRRCTPKRAGTTYMHRCVCTQPIGERAISFALSRASDMVGQSRLIVSSVSGKHRASQNWAQLRRLTVGSASPGPGHRGTAMLSYEHFAPHKGARGKCSCCLVVPGTPPPIGMHAASAHAVWTVGGRSKQHEHIGRLCFFLGRLCFYWPPTGRAPANRTDRSGNCQKHDKCTEPPAMGDSDGLPHCRPSLANAHQWVTAIVSAATIRPADRPMRHFCAPIGCTERLFANGRR